MGELMGDGNDSRDRTAYVQKACRLQLSLPRPGCRAPIAVPARLLLGGELTHAQHLLVDAVLLGLVAKHLVNLVHHLLRQLRQNLRARRWAQPGKG